VASDNAALNNISADLGKPLSLEDLYCVSQFVAGGSPAWFHQTFPETAFKLRPSVIWSILKMVFNNGWKTFASRRHQKIHCKKDNQRKMIFRAE
jgi:hypothetical protein